MTTITNNVVRQEFRESNVNLTHAPRVDKEPEIKKEELLTLPEIKFHLDDILKETQIKYSIDEHDNGYIIKVLDKKTDEIIKEIPSHDLQVLRKHFKTYLGVLFNELI